MLRRNRKRQRESDLQHQEAADGDDEDEWDACAELVDDTLTTIQLLVSRSTAGFAAINLPPLVLWHQLYTVFPNRTYIDQSVHRLRNEGALVTFRIPTGPNDMAIIRKSDYVDELEKWLRLLRSQRQRSDDNGTDANPATAVAIGRKHDALARFIRIVASICQLPSIPFKVLREELMKRQRASSTGVDTAAAMDEQAMREDVAWLQRLGFLRTLTRLDDEVFHLSVPGVGKLVSAVKKTRTALVSTLKRTKYKETAEAQIKKLKLQHSRFDWDYHLADMEGSGLIRRTKVTSGTLVTLADK